MKDINISVAMATFNGEKYIEEQITSILKNLTNNDELIISDDNSSDKTIEIINKMMSIDSRIKLIQGPCLGIKKNFENAIKNCHGKYIFLADQDDIWMENKTNIVLKYLKGKTTLVIHDAHVIDENYNIIMDSFYKFRNSKKGILKNIVKNSYIGCCMAFDSSIKDKILPIPNDTEMHDQWIGLKNELHGKSLFIKEKLIDYRRHDNNVSSLKHHRLVKMFKNRLILIYNLIK